MLAVGQAGSCQASRSLPAATGVMAQQRWWVEGFSGSSSSELQCEMESSVLSCAVVSKANLCLRRGKKALQYRFPNDASVFQGWRLAYLKNEKRLLVPFAFQVWINMNCIFPKNKPSYAGNGWTCSNISLETRCPCTFCNCRQSSLAVRGGEVCSPCYCWKTAFLFREERWKSTFSLCYQCREEDLTDADIIP